MIKFGEVRFYRFNERALIAAMKQAKSKSYARKIGQDKSQKARSLAPVDTGRLRDSINFIVIEDDKVGWQVVVYAATEYAIYVEFGTVNAAAQPYLRPALYTRLGGSGNVQAVPSFEV